MIWISEERCSSIKESKTAGVHQVDLIGLNKRLNIKIH